MNAIIRVGAGLPAAGEYVETADEQLYCVVSVDGPVRSRAGETDYVHATVRSTAWDEPGDARWECTLEGAPGWHW